MTTTLESLAEILKKIEIQCEKNGKDLKELKSDIGKEISTIKEDIKQIRTSFNAEVTQLKSNFTEIKTSQTFIGTQFEDHRKIIQNVMKKNKQLEDENTEHVKRFRKLEKELREEKIKRDDLEAYGRRSCLEINGIPQLDDENCITIVNSVANLLEINIDNSIDVAHRVTSARKNSSIIVKFKDRTSRDNLFESRNKLKDFTTADIEHDGNKSFPSSTNSKIWINESLTPTKKKLLWLARTKAEKLGWFEQENSGRCFTRNGLVYACKSKNAERIKIQDERDIDKIK